MVKTLIQSYSMMTNITNEQWQDIEGNKGYQISDCGRVRSVDRIITYRDGRQRFCKGQLLNPSPDKAGYLMVCLRNHKTRRVAGLVAKAFIPNPNNLPEVNHIDTNKNNNSVGNLEWCTKTYNQRHAWKSGCKEKVRKVRSMLSKQQQGELSPYHKLTAKDVLSIRYKYIPRQHSLRMLAKEYNVSHSAILDIIKGKQWKGVKQNVRGN